ncbi:Sesquithujene synthase A, partial [Cymbomonas tetramitiformis]
ESATCALHCYGISLQIHQLDWNAKWCVVGAESQAKELVGHLEDLLVGEPVDVSVGQSTVEIKPKGINKGSAVERVLQYVAEEGGLTDMVMCVGDDRSDEEMFVGLRARRSQFGTEDCKVFACTVGQKPSKAEYYVNDPAEVLEILKACTHISKDKELQS